MARRLIFKESGLTGSVPSGYKAVGFNGLTFSQLTSAGALSNVGGSSGGGGLTNFTESLSTSSPNNTVYVTSLTATASATNVDIAIVPKGTGAIVTAIPDSGNVYGNKRGARAVDLQLTRDYYTRVASGAYSFLVGANSTASGEGSVGMGVSVNATGANCVAIGVSTNATSTYCSAIGQSANATGGYSYAFGGTVTASGQESVCIGAWSSATNTYSTSLGRNHVSSGVGSAALGYGANTFGRYGSITFAGGSSNNQTSIMIYRGVTTNASTTSLNAQEYFEDSSNTLSLQNNSALRFKGIIVAKQTGSSNIAAWDVDGLLMRGANAASTTLVTSNVTLVSNSPGWGTPVLSAGTTYGNLKVEVTGAASTNIRWTVKLEATEVIY